MQDPYFKPWVGINYFSSKPKILILGESHYYEHGEAAPTFTQDVVKYWALNPNKSLRFFTIIAKILSGKPYDWMDFNEKEKFWQSVAFYNYIQKLVGGTARIRPSLEMWKDAKEPFGKVLLELSPDIVIVLGKELGGHIKEIEAEQRFNSQFCYWNHPSSPKFFNKKQAIADFQLIKDIYGK